MSPPDRLPPHLRRLPDAEPKIQAPIKNFEEGAGAMFMPEFEGLTMQIQRGCREGETPVAVSDYGVIGLAMIEGPDGSPGLALQLVHPDGENSLCAIMPFEDVALFCETFNPLYGRIAERMREYDEAMRQAKGAPRQ